MGFNPFSLIASIFVGTDPLKTITSALTTAQNNYLNSKDEALKAKYKAEVDELTLMYGDLANARSSLAKMPRWITIPGGMVAFTLGLHLTLIGIGTILVAPFYWQADCGLGKACYVVGHGPLEFTRHIPVLPAPLDTGELWFLGLLFGGGLVLGALRKK